VREYLQMIAGKAASLALSPSRAQSVPDLAGEGYGLVLQRFHQALRPKSYLEIGTQYGDSLALAQCPAIAVDPVLNELRPTFLGGKEVCALFQMQSDSFFARYDPKAIFGMPVEMAFLDGMHHCEFLLRDFANTERHCRRNSVVFLHDCVPVESAIAERAHLGKTIEPHRKDWWLGDVWRTLLALKRRRPDLQIAVLDAAPSGLACISNLNPENTTLFDDYPRIVADMMSWSLKEIGLLNYHQMLDIQPTSTFDTDDKITSRFCL
jgi:hypothetical protein